MLKVLRRDAKLYQNDGGTVTAINRSAIGTGVIDSYCWARIGVENMKSHSYHLPSSDAEALINVSGAAVLKSVRRPDAAQCFLAFLVDPSVQELMAKSRIDFEHLLDLDFATNPILKPFSELQPPKLSVGALGDDRSAGKLLRGNGLI